MSEFLDSLRLKHPGLETGEEFPDSREIYKSVKEFVNLDDVGGDCELLEWKYYELCVDSLYDAYNVMLLLETSETDQKWFRIMTQMFHAILESHFELFNDVCIHN